LPSPSNQARVVHDVVALAKRMHYHVNLIEAFDQPWKRILEGTVGGHWGLFDVFRQPKFAFGNKVSDHPFWRWQAGGGAVFTVLVFAAGFWGRRRTKPSAGAARVWVGIALGAIAGGALAPWAVESARIESLGLVGTLRMAALVLVALLGPPLAAAGLAAGAPIPSFAQVLGPAERRPRDGISAMVGAAMVLLAVLAVQTALGLVFDPRYRDFPFAALCAATLPLLLLSVLGPPAIGSAGLAERVAAALLCLSAAYIALNEGFANWQAIWLCAVFVAIGVILLRLRDAPGSE
jgi:glucan 1,3-beta-glucosidase